MVHITQNDGQGSHYNQSVNVSSIHAQQPHVLNQINTLLPYLFELLNLHQMLQKYMTAIMSKLLDLQLQHHNDHVIADL